MPAQSLHALSHSQHRGVPLPESHPEYDADHDSQYHRHNSQVIYRDKFGLYPQI
ncbi:hypothetical protein BMETH_1423_0 [methanotrophic bacterial endosymbiont of Bathymodiolus sp.]|nr:hypothetical protein BMETH_1423_0 [methanotrophic bacterial endosymbiont of Bathymodiolus sp.]